MPQAVIDEIREHLVRIEKKLDHIFNGDPEDQYDLGLKGRVSNLERRLNENDKEKNCHKKMIWAIVIAMVTGLGGFITAMISWFK